MKNILDPEGVWLSAPPLALASGNKRPVTVEDLLFVAVNGAPVTVNVLGNDFDPEGQPLTLISASAALGSATTGSGGQVTYTPPPGVSGFDTVVYTVADDLGQQRDGQINVTIVEPGLSITTTALNTLVVTAEPGTVDLTVTSPADFAGTSQVATGDLNSGPVNLAIPEISGTPTPGATLNAMSGLWAYDPAAGEPEQSWQWQRDGNDIPGATAASYVLQPGDLDLGVSVLDIQNDSRGQRFAVSETLGAGPSPDFDPSQDTALIGWWDADDPATLTTVDGAVASWASKSGIAALSQDLTPVRPGTGQRDLNGRNLVDFDGSQFLATDLDLPASGDVVFHMVLLIDGVSSDFAAILAVDATNDFQIDSNDVTDFQGRLNLTGSGMPVALSGGPYSGPLILSALFDRSGAGLAQVYIGNSLRGQTAYTVPLDPSVVLTLMSNRSQNANVDGAVAEVIVTGNVANRAVYHSYLSSKWGLT